MKSLYSVLFAFGILFIAILALTPEEDKKLLDECKNSVEATDEDVKLLVVEQKVPQERKGKCLLKCAYEKFGIILEGSFSIERARAIGSKELGDNEKAINIFNEMINECQAVADPDICEHSAKFMDCMLKAALKRGIDPKKGIVESIRSV